jgi:hypothetical protein
MRMSGPVTCLAMFAAATLAPTAGRASPEDEPLGRLINRELHAGGPFFTPAERALIERKCGYAPGQYDGFQANISNGVFTCGNGRRVDDAEMRDMLRTAEPRISRRVRAVMARPAVTAAIDRVARLATERAMRQVRARLDARND